MRGRDGNRGEGRKIHERAGREKMRETDGKKGREKEDRNREGGS